MFGFFQLKSLSRAKNSISTSGMYDFYPQCFVKPSGYKRTFDKNHALQSLGA
jgi:hypothetical protein